MQHGLFSTDVTLPLNQSASCRRYLLFVLAVLFSVGGLAADPVASELIRRMEGITRGNSSHARLEITIERPRFTRTLVLESWEDSKQRRSFIRILRPKKDEGVAFLKWGDRLWQYIPKIGKEIRIEGSLLQDSWMGSDFTNDDLVKASSTMVDYGHTFLPDPGPGLKRVLLTPKPGAPVAWSKMIMDIGIADALPVRQELYDHKGRLVKLQEYSDVRTMGGRRLPTQFVMHTMRNGRRVSSTKLRFLTVRFDLAISPAVFSRANLRR